MTLHEISVQHAFSNVNFNSDGDFNLIYVNYKPVSFRLQCQMSHPKNWRKACAHVEQLEEKFHGADAV